MHASHISFSVHVKLSLYHIISYVGNYVYESKTAITIQDSIPGVYGHITLHTVRVTKKSPCGFLTFFHKHWEFLINFSLTYYTFLFTLDYKFLFNYLQFLRSYAILSETTHRFFLHFTRTLLLSLLTEQMTSLLTSCHIQHVC